MTPAPDISKYKNSTSLVSAVIAVVSVSPSVMSGAERVYVGVEVSAIVTTEDTETAPPAGVLETKNVKDSLPSRILSCFIETPNEPDPLETVKGSFDEAVA